VASLCNLSKKLGHLSRLLPIGIQTAFEKSPGDIFFQVRSLIGPGRQNNGSMFDMPSRPTYKRASQLICDVHVCLAQYASDDFPLRGRMQFDLA
jgi:hypothetical protein